jgi:hypothetical protein
MPSVEDLEARLRRLEDIEAIRRLKFEYCAACDDDHNPDRLVSLFTPDGVWANSGVRTLRAEGHDGIRRIFQKIRDGKTVIRSAHLTMNPEIDVHGDTANGVWRFHMLYTAPRPDGGQQYQRVIGYYREEYVRQADGWRFRLIDAHMEEDGAYTMEARAFR